MKSSIKSISSPIASRTAFIVARSSRGIGTAQPKLPGPESPAPLVEQFDRLGCRGFRRLQPHSVAIIRVHGPDRAAEQNAEGHVGRFGQRVPGRHVEASDSDHRQTLIANEMKRLAGRFVEIDRRNTPTFEHLAKIEQRRDQVLHCFRQVGFEVAPAHNTLFGKKVDENDRQMGHGADTRDGWPGHLADGGSGLDFLESQ